MIPIPSAHQLMKEQPGTQFVDHLINEVEALRAELEKRTPQFNVNATDLSFIRAAKRVMVDTMIGTGMNYNVCGNVSAIMEVMLADLNDVLK